MPGGGIEEGETVDADRHPRGHGRDRNRGGVRPRRRRRRGPGRPLRPAQAHEAAARVLGAHPRRRPRPLPLDSRQCGGRGLGPARRLHLGARPQTRRRLRHTRTRAPRLRARRLDTAPCRPRRSRRDARGGSRARDQGRDGRRRRGRFAPRRRCRVRGALRAAATIRAGRSTPFRPATRRTLGRTACPGPAWTRAWRCRAGGSRSRSVHSFGGGSIPWSNACSCR